MTRCPPRPGGAFDLPEHLSAKARPALIAVDDRHFAVVAACLEQTTTVLSERLDSVGRVHAGAGQSALDRDQEVHRLTARLCALGRFGLDLCLGRMVRSGDDDHSQDPAYFDRFGLTDEGRHLLLDWRSRVRAVLHRYPR